MRGRAGYFAARAAHDSRSTSFVGRLQKARAVFVLCGVYCGLGRYPDVIDAKSQDGINRGMNRILMKFKEHMKLNVPTGQGIADCKAVKAAADAQGCARIHCGARV